MADSTTASLDDIKTSGSGFTFTGKLAEFAVNGDWVDGYHAVSDGFAKRNDYSTMWEMLSAGTEESGNRIYREIRSYVDKIGNVDTCGLRALKNIADTIGFKDDLVDANLTLPVEINGIVEIFSVNSAYLMDKADGVSGSVLLNSILDSDTAAKFGDAVKDRDSFRSFVSDVVYNTIFKFLTLKVGKFYDGKTEDYDKEIWRRNISQFTTELWSDDVTPDETIFELKNSLGVSKSFTEKIYADKVVSGEAKLDDFSYEEQKVISAEIEARKTRYSDAPQMRYYFMRLYKVLEYFRFVSLTYRKIYELGEYDLNANKFVVTDVTEDFSLVKNNYADYEIDDTVVHKVADWIADFCIGLSYVRTRMKRQSQRNMMKGTKRLIVDAIREFLLEQVDSETWNGLGDSVLRGASLNRDFDVSLIEYTDGTEYFNIENETDVVDPQTNGLNRRFWEKYGDSASAFSKDEVLAFYNRVNDDRRRYSENDEEGAADSSTNLYEFLKILFESGASSALNSDYFTVSQTLTATSGTETASAASGEVNGRTAEVLEKFSGDPDVSTTYYYNIKNSFHPSYQIHPFVQGFEEYNAAYTSVMNLVNSFSDTIETSIARISDSIDRIGCTVNFWYNWNEDFTGYSTNYEKGGSDYDPKVNQDSPFDFDALREFITFPDEFVLNILQGLNQYYRSELTGKPYLNSEETSIEISRLQRYRQDIIDISGKAVYRYAKDFYGNIYVLYKDEGDRTNRNALGNVWVRLKNHPIAFPLFDVNESSTPFSEVSCISDSDNEKLIRLLQTVVRRFNSEYGLGGGYVESDNLTLSFETKTVSAMIVTDDSGYPVKGEDTVVESGVGRVNLQCVEIENSVLAEAIADIGVKRLSGLASELSSTEYFVDSVNGEAVNATFVVSSVSGGIEGVASNPYGRICHPPTSAYLKATYENDVFTVLRNTESVPLPETYAYVTFADYDDTAVAEEGVTYSYTNEYGITHPCGKRRITIRNVYNIPSDCYGKTPDVGETLLSGNVDSAGNVDFGVWSESGDTKTVRTSSRVSVDGTDVYENFDFYTYAYLSGDTYRYHPDKGVHDIVMVGGSNPYYVKRTVNDDSTTSIKLLRAWRATDSEPDTYVFRNKAYNTIIGPVALTSFPLSDCQFRKNERVENVLDTIHQFQLKDNQYVNYYPYTRIAVDPTEDIGNLDSSKPSGCITFYDDEDDLVGHKFYYNIHVSLKDFTQHALSAKVLTAETSAVVVTSKNVRLGGSLSLHTNDSSKYPVTLTFNGETDSNVGTFSTYYGSNEYQKFFDMGFSYDQKMMYMAYREDDDAYENGGILIGRVQEKENPDGTTDLVYYRDSGNNIEGVEPSNIRYYHQMSERFEYFRQDYLSGEPYFVLDTQIPFINERAMTFQSLNDSLNDGETWQSVFMNTSSTEISALTALAETDTRMAYTTLTAITGMITSSIDYRTYVDGIKTRHLGETVSKNGIYSAFGSFNERDRVLNMTVYLFLTGKTVTSNFAIPLRFDPMVFDDDPRGRISTKLSCTDKRLYFSFASCPPASGDVLLNGINGDVNGDAGGTTYGSVSAMYGDCTVTILSFNIEDKDAVELAEDETRYIFKGVELGFFPQYGGIGGKNLVFRSASLSGKTEFPFEVAFDPVGAGEDVRMTRTITVSGSDSARVGLSKFVNLDDEFSYSSDERSRGILVSDDGSKAFYVPFERSVFSDVSKMYSFENVDGRKILDVSRPHVNANTGTDDSTVIIADGENGSRFVGAISDFGFSSAPTVLKMPVSCSGDYEFRTDFKTIEDADGRVFALHSDGKTVSEVEVGYRTDGAFLPECGIVSHTLTSSVSVSLSDITKCGDDTFEKAIPEDGYDGFSNDAYAKYASVKVTDGGSTVIDVFNGDDGSILQSRFSTSKDNVTTFFSGASAFVAMRSGTVGNGEEFRVYPMEADVAVGKPYAAFSIEPTGQRITAFEDTLSRSLNDDSNPTNKIFTTNTQRVYRLDIVTSGESPVLSAHEADTFDKVVEDGILSTDTELQNGVEVCMGHSANHILFAYYSKEQDAHGMVYSRKATPDSVGEYCSFVDEGGNAVNVNRITRILSMGSLVVAQDESGDSTTILVSTDDGVTFVRKSELVGCNIRLVGCGQYGFYAHSSNGSLIRSSDGVNWKVDGTMPFSRWTSVTVDGKQYLLCESKEDGIDGYYKDRYLEIRQQTTVDSDREFTLVSVDNGVVVAVSCEDATLPLAIARADEDDLDGIETVVFQTAKGIAFSNSCGFGGDLFLSPESAERVVRIDGAFELETIPSFKYIDISGVGSADRGTFGGFVELNGKLVMYPDTAEGMLVYNESGDRFFEYCSVGSNVGIADCDSVAVESEGISEAVLTPSVTESDGTADLVVTNVFDRNNYGMVEIDDGFPIVVEYSTSTIDGGSEVTQFRFTMLSDSSRRTATITTVPNGVSEAVKSAYVKKSSATVSYTVGSKTMIYTFSTVDDRPRYVISKSVDVSTDYEDKTYLRIRMSLDDFNRASSGDDAVRMAYSSDSASKVCVYDDFAYDSYVQEVPSGEGETAITKFADYVFADTAAFSGAFKRLSVSPRERVADSNLSFGGSATVEDCSDMFSGCVNAEMGDSLDINGSDASSSVVSADRMFKDCRSAVLPYVSIDGSNIETCESMFENCVNAELGGVGIPHGAKSIRGMFKNCRSAAFDSLTVIPESVSLDSVFYGCESGTFGKASFFAIEDFGNDSCAVGGYDTSYMFYMCGNMNAQSLSFQRVSPYVRVADRMFFGAGRNASVMFNDTVTVFARLHSADRMFNGSNFEFDNSYMQFHGVGGTLRDGDATSFSIPNDMTLSGIESFFEGTKYAAKSPTTVLASSDISISDMDSALDGALYGHYLKTPDGTLAGIMNFNSLYRGSSMAYLDLRGIANNSDMDVDFNSNSDTVGRQTFASMCENCGNLKEIRGYIPPYGSDYSSMFRNCSSLDVDISKMFRVHDAKGGKWSVESAYADGTLKSYNMSSISHMFDGCASVYSTDAAFDLAMVVDSCAHTLSLLGIDAANAPKSFECAFGNKMVIAPKESMDGLGSLDFSADDAASRMNAVKYAATDALRSKYGIGTDFMKMLYPNGFMRYCGTFRTDPTRYVAVIYYPERDYYDNVISLAPKTIGRTIGVAPYGFADNYAVGQTHKDSTWYEYDYDTLYAAAIFDTATNALVKYAYVGEYDLVKHEYLISDGKSVRADSVSRASAAVFSGLESTIEPLA